MIKDVSKILVVKLRGIGDVVLSTVVFDSLTAQFPGAKIDFLTEKASKPVLDGLEFIDDVLIFDRKSLLKRIKLLFEVRRRKYDLILDLFSNPSTAQITFFSGAKFRAGFPYQGRKYAYNFFGPEERDKHHSADLHLELLKSVGIKIVSKKLYFSLDELTKSKMYNYLKRSYLKNNLLVGISTTGGWKSKKCDPEKFAEIGDEIRRRLGADIIILWGKGDEKESVEISELMTEKSTLPPDTTLKELAALIYHCDLVVANDSGPMHISTALGTPVLSLHGPTNPRTQGPYGDGHEFIQVSELYCIECQLLECPHNHECFMEMKIDDIMKKIESLIEINRIRSIEES